MRYIVLDLEWNQPLSYSSPAYRQVGDKLLFEMIQIGAVMLDENRAVTDTFNQLIQPAHYIKLHPRIKRITQISQDDLAGAPGFLEAMRLFVDWCGEDYALLTWGCDDISVLRQNMEFFGCDIALAPIYDLQRLFGDIVKEPKNRKGLQAAMAHYQIEPDAAMAFHNALHDAYYTAQVFQRFPDPAEALKYPQTARKLIHSERRRSGHQEMTVNRTADGMRSSAAIRPNCPVCGKRLTLTHGFVKQRERQYMALTECPTHGLEFVRLQFSKKTDGKRTMIRTVEVSDEQSKAYVATKRLQWENKLAKQESEGQP